MFTRAAICTQESYVERMCLHYMVKNKKFALKKNIFISSTSVYGKMRD